jgi:hypothetical protein
MIRSRRGAALNSIMNFQVPLKMGNFGIIRATVSFSRVNLSQAIIYIEPGIFF